MLTIVIGEQRNVFSVNGISYSCKNENDTNLAISLILWLIYVYPLVILAISGLPPYKKYCLDSNPVI